MWFELLLAGFIMAVGLAIAGTVSSYYQWIFDTPAALRYEGKTYVHALGHLVVSRLDELLPWNWRDAQTL